MTPIRLPLLLWHLGRRGGGPRFTYELARALQQRDDVALHLGLSRQSELFEQSVALGAPVLTIDTYSGLPGFVTGLARLPSIARQIRHYIAANEIPLALCGMTHPWNWFLTPSVKRAGALSALVVHDAIPHPGENQWIHRYRIAKDLQQTDAVITLSGAVHNQVLSVYGMAPEKVGLTGIPPFRYGRQNDGRLRHLATDRPIRLLFFGRLLPYKGLEQMLAAMRILQERGAPVQLRIVGNGPLELPNLPANVSLERRWVAEDDIAGLFEQADLLVVPYQEASQSGVLAIARGAGLPALVTPVGGLVEQIRGGGFVTAAADEVSIADGVQAVVADPTGYAEIAAALATQDGDDDWAKSTEEIMSMLRVWR